MTPAIAAWLLIKARSDLYMETEELKTESHWLDTMRKNSKTDGKIWDINIADSERRCKSAKSRIANLKQVIIDLKKA